MGQPYLGFQHQQMLLPYGCSALEKIMRRRGGGLQWRSINRFLCFDTNLIRKSNCNDTEGWAGLYGKESYFLWHNSASTWLHRGLDTSFEKELKAWSNRLITKYYHKVVPELYGGKKENLRQNLFKYLPCILCDCNITLLLLFKNNESLATFAKKSGQ